MSSTVWTIDIGGTVVSQSKIIGFSFSSGRRSYFDSFAGNTITITARNVGNYFNPTDFAIGEQIKIQTGAGATLRTRFFWLTSIEYQDSPNPDAAIAVISGVDGITRLGTIPIDQTYAKTQRGSVSQCNSFFLDYQTINGGATPGGIEGMPSIGNPDYSAGDSTVAGFTADGLMTFQERINLNAQAENVAWDVFDYTSTRPAFYMYARSKQKAPFVSFDWTPTAGKLTYTNPVRSGLGDGFYNAIRVSFGANYALAWNDNRTTYGEFGVNIVTNSAAVMASYNQAPYIANTIGEYPTKGDRFLSIDFIDGHQEQATLDTWNGRIWSLNSANVKVYYPDGTSANKPYKIEGVDVRVEAGLTTYRLYLTDLSMYQFFTLDNTTFGVLDTSRLGW